VSHENHREFLAAIAETRGRRPPTAARREPIIREELITRVVTVRVVEVLEWIDVDHGDRVVASRGPPASRVSARRLGNPVSSSPYAIACVVSTERNEQDQVPHP
jgi:hypothetical protein